MLLFHRKAGKKNRWPSQLVQLALVLWKCATCIKICRKNAVLSCEALFSIGPIRFSRPGLGLPPLGLWWHTKSMISLINEICHLCQRAWPHSIDSHWRFSSLPTQHAIHQVSRLQTRQLVRFLECCPCLGWHLHSCTLAYHGNSHDKRYKPREIGMWRLMWCVCGCSISVTNAFNVCIYVLSLQ